MTQQQTACARMVRRLKGLELEYLVLDAVEMWQPITALELSKKLSFEKYTVRNTLGRLIAKDRVRVISKPCSFQKNTLVNYYSLRERTKQQE